MNARQDMIDVAARVTLLLMVLIAVLALATCVARDASAQTLVYGNRVEIPLSVDFDTEVPQMPAPLQRLMRFATQDGELTVMQVNLDGSISLRFSATIDFSPNMWMPKAGPHAGYFVVRMGGDNLYLIPMFHLPGVIAPPPSAGLYQ